MHPDTRIVETSRLYFATQRKPFWRYLAREVVVALFILLVVLPVALACLFVEWYFKLPELSGMFMAIGLFVLFFAVKAWRRQE